MNETRSLVALERDALIAEAKRRTGLSEFGAAWFTVPLDKLIECMHAESKLSGRGEALWAERLTTFLENRLIRNQLLKDHPEILDEKVEVSAAILSLGRTGSTKTFRLLASPPCHTGIKGWEGYFPFPLEGEEPGKPVARRLRSQAIKDAGPDMEAVFGKTTIESPVEEVFIIEQGFVGTSFECYAWLPTFIDWMKGFDQMPAYDELRVVLQVLQWQDPSRRGAKWILKSPTHMSAPKTLLDAFPNSLIVQTHREPLKTMPSHCSMITPLYGIYSDDYDAKAVGRFTCMRWAQMTNDVIDLREKIGDDRFIDIQYEDLTADAMGVMRAVFERMGQVMRPLDEAAMEQWLIDNKRDKWAPHIYDLESHGLSEEIIKSDFARYREKHILNQA